jgi:hypothetical protein
MKSRVGNLWVDHKFRKSHIFKAYRTLMKLPFIRPTTRYVKDTGYKKETSYRKESGYIKKTGYINEEQHIKV